MTRIFSARILVWSPESIVEKTILLAGWANSCEHEHILEKMLEAGPVTYDEPGFRWRTQPEHHGLFVWVGMLEIDDDSFFFDGTWEDPTAQDLYHMAGIDTSRIEGAHATA